AEALLFRASTMSPVGRYQLEAAIQSAHVVRRRTGAADWAAIEQLYDALSAMTGSPVVAINRAIAVAETRGPAAGLATLDVLADDARLAEYQPYWAARQQPRARGPIRLVFGEPCVIRQHIERREPGGGTARLGNSDGSVDRHDRRARHRRQRIIELLDCCPV